MQILQMKDTYDILDEVKYVNEETLEIPKQHRQSLTANDGQMKKSWMYMWVFGCLCYLIITRHKYKLFNHSSNCHMQSQLNVILKWFSYEISQKHSLGRGLLFPLDGDFQLIVFSDYKDTCWSIIGYCALLEKNLIAWRTKEQTTIPWSSTEVRNISLTSVSCNVLCPKYLLSYLRVTPSSVMLLMWNNKSANSNC